MTMKVSQEEETGLTSYFTKLIARFETGKFLPYAGVKSREYKT
jgi:hypothetical protein